MSDKVMDTLIIKDGGIFLRLFHEERTFEALQFLNLGVKRPQVDAIYSEIEEQHRSLDGRVLRIIFSHTLPLSYTVEPRELETLPAPVKLSQVPAPEFSGASRFKWEDRSRWNELLPRKHPEAHDILAVNKRGQLVETSRCNIFAYEGERDLVLTPPVSSGCINGVYRRFVLSEGAIELPDIGRKVVVEEDIPVERISDYKLFVANSVRAVLPAAFIPG